MTGSRPTPTFTSLIVYRSLEYRYSFLYPEGWHHIALDSEGGQGVILSPSPDDITTSFSIEARDLGTTITADDLPALREGFIEGLRGQRDARIVDTEDYVVGGLVALEARLTFRDDDARRKRWVRLLYQGSTQARMIAQGATEEEFEYWLPMFTQMMRTFRFGDWWAEVTGQEWQATLDRQSAEAEEDPPRA